MPLGLRSEALPAYERLEQTALGTGSGLRARGKTDALRFLSAPPLTSEARGNVTARGPDHHAGGLETRPVFAMATSVFAYKRSPGKWSVLRDLFFFFFSPPKVTYTEAPPVKPRCSSVAP